jgi:hypothetical protein
MFSAFAHDNVCSKNIPCLKNNGDDNDNNIDNNDNNNNSHNPDTVFFCCWEGERGRTFFSEADLK